MLEARNLSYYAGHRPLVEDVSVIVKPGEVHAIVGANGAGKSTLLKLITGDLLPSQGEVWLNGTPLKQWKKRDRAQLRAILPQSTLLSFGFTVLEVVLMGRIPHVRGKETPQDYAIAREALEATHTDHLADRIYTSLSGGEQQRVQLARVLAQIWNNETNQPRYLLLDEPTNSLDLAHQHATLVIARSFAAQGVGVLAILHDLNLVGQYADYVVMMKAGRSIASGSPEKVLEPKLIREAFNIDVMVAMHPKLNRPYIIPDSQQ